MDTVAENLKAIVREQTRHEDITGVINILQSLNISNSIIEEKLMTTYHLDKQEAERYIRENEKATV